MERHHPVTSEQEIPVDIGVAAFVAVNFSAERLHNLRLVEPFADPSKLSVAKRSTILTLHTDVVGILSGTLVGANDSVVAVDCCGHARPNALAIVAAFDEGLAARKCVVHCLALALVDNSWPASITASHGPVVLVLSQAISEAVTNED